MDTLTAFRNWGPIRLSWGDDDVPSVHWFRFGDITFDDAYFIDTVQRAAKRPFNLVFRRQTTIDVACDIASQHQSLPLSGIILHMSRCGSTLVSRAFATRPDTLVVSEPGPINDVLTMQRSEVSEEERVRWLRSIAALLARPQYSEQTRAIFKLDAWHARYLPTLKAAFPEVPIVFLWRDAVEVIVSHMEAMSYMMAAANAPFAAGLAVTDAICIPREEYCAKVLASIIESIQRSNLPRSHLIGYTDLPNAIWERIGPLFGVTFSAREIERVSNLAYYHAKHPHQPFAGDTREKHQRATDAILDAARSLEPLCEWLRSAPIK